MLPSPLSFFFGILYAGGHGGVDIPVPVPNTEVKRPYADDTPDRGKVGSRRLFFVLNGPLRGEAGGGGQGAAAVPAKPAGLWQTATRQ